ncbi:hypothetical protein QJS10_CPA03g00473 [Acorus calamus]|uniref:Uncharacterized protein n=1 Tax=Acorus calamus TaxID=4465 RepID=A0AAV9F3U0_ACOCL|nr:hypothetical protein QJS10_CPA03g00473 [Acorus calamus]
MGNNPSCTPSIPSVSCGGGTTPTTKVIVSGAGKVEQYRIPIKAAELMLENPNKFVCDSEDLKVGRRVPGLAADEVLGPRKLYFLLPMDMLYSVLTDDELRSLFSTEKKKRKKKKKIFPFGEFCMFPSETVDAEREAVKSGGGGGKVAGRMTRQRSWMPGLDTIEEVW